MKTVNTTPAHKAFRDDLVAALKKHEHLSPLEMLAITSQIVGQLIALQDQRKYTPPMIMAMVTKNIETGNQTAINTVLGHTKGTA